MKTQVLENEEYLEGLLSILSERSKQDKKCANAATALRHIISIKVDLFNDEDDYQSIFTESEKFKDLGKRYLAILRSEVAPENLSKTLKGRLSVKKAALNEANKVAVELAKAAEMQKILTESTPTRSDEEETSEIWLESEFQGKTFGDSLLIICGKAFPEIISANAKATKLSEIAEVEYSPDTIRRHFKNEVSLANTGRGGKGKINIPIWDRSIAKWEAFFGLPEFVLRRHLPTGSSCLKRPNKDLTNPDYIRGGEGVSSYGGLTSEAANEYRNLALYMANKVKTVPSPRRKPRKAAAKKENMENKRLPNFTNGVSVRFPEFQPVNRMKAIKRRWKINPRDNSISTADSYESTLRCYQYHMVEAGFIEKSADFRLSDLLIQERMESFIDYRIKHEAYGTLDVFLGFIISQLSSSMSSLAYLSIVHTPVEHYELDEFDRESFFDWQDYEADLRARLMQLRVDITPDLKSHKNDGKRNVRWLIDREGKKLHEFDEVQEHGLESIAAGTYEYYQIANSLAASGRVGGIEGFSCMLYGLFLKLMLSFPMRVTNWCDLEIVDEKDSAEFLRKKPVMWRSKKGIWEITAPELFVKNGRKLCHTFEQLTDQIDEYMVLRSTILNDSGNTSNKFIISAQKGDYKSIKSAKSSFGQGLSRYTYAAIQELWPERIADGTVKYGFNPHGLRHFTATSALAHGAEPSVVQSLLQDSEKVTKDIYAELDKLRVKRGVKQVHVDFVNMYDSGD